MQASTNSEGRPFAAVLSSIFGNLQDIVRSEIRLVKAEAVDDLAALTHAASWLAVALLSAFFALGFLLFAGFFVLLHFMPDWAAALVMAVSLAVVGSTAFLVYRGRGTAMRRSRNSLPDIKPEEPAS